jgi:cleavage and polyadenylation specificity factor subunit 4
LCDFSVSGDPSLATSFGVGGFRGDLKHRTIVCRHWLLGLCQNGSSCGYLHRLDKSKMPACKHGNQCKIKNCPLKHTDELEISECIFYKQGFCYNGVNCVRRHVKRSPDECPFEVLHLL